MWVPVYTTGKDCIKYRNLEIPIIEASNSPKIKFTTDSSMTSYLLSVRHNPEF